MSTPSRRWLLYQLADSAFPTGGFAHSAGLEAAVQIGEIAGAAGLARFVHSAIWQTGLSLLPFVGAAYSEPDAITEIDHAADVFLNSAVQNRASRTQGRALLGTSAKVFPDAPGLRDLDARVRARSIHAHFAPLFGSVGRALGASRQETQELALHLGLRGVLSAAVRLGVVGPHEGQRLQHAQAPLLETVLTSCADLGIHEVAQPAPHFDLLASTQDRLYSRLFQS